MRCRSTLWLAGLLAVLAPTTAPAQVRTIAVNPSGDVHVSLRGDGINARGVVPVRSGRVEIQMGDWVGGYRQFMLTRLTLIPSGFNVGNKEQFRDVGVHLRSALMWWGRDISTPQEMVTGGNYEIDIPSDALYTNGDPLFLGTAIVKKDEYDNDPKTIDAADRVVGSIRGYVNLSERRYYLRFTLRGTIKAPWWQPWADDVTRTFFFRVWGEMPDTHYAKEPPPPIADNPVDLPPSDDPNEPEEPPDPFERVPPLNEPRGAR